MAIFPYCSKCFYEPVCYQEAATIPFIVDNVCKSFYCFPAADASPQPSGAKCQRADIRPVDIEGDSSPVMPFSVLPEADAFKLRILHKVTMNMLSTFYQLMLILDVPIPELMPDDVEGSDGN